MRFCDPFVLTANSYDCEQALARRKRIGAKSSVQCGPTHLIVFSPRAIFLRQIARPTQCPKNLTEFLFGPNFSKPDLGGI